MATKPILSHLDGNQNELQNWSIQKLATDPVSPFEGQIWLNTTTNKYKIYAGGVVRELAYMTDLLGLLDYKGGYNATTNTPDLDVAPSGVSKGDVYTVTVGGLFFTEDVEVGDMLIAEIDNPTTLDDWTRVQYNLPTNLAKKFAVDLDNAETSVVRVFSGGQTTFTITHNLNSLDVIADVKRISDGKVFGFDITATGVNTLTVVANGNIADDLYRITIVG